MKVLCKQQTQNIENYLQFGGTNFDQIEFEPVYGLISVERNLNVANHRETFPVIKCT